MKKLVLVCFLFSTGVSSVVAQAPMRGPAALSGTWLLEATALKREGARTQENIEWHFQNDGRLVMTGYNYIVNRVITVEDSYQIADGKIETGQSGNYTVVEKNEKEMILKGAYGFYFFRRQ
jgi:hypothetical protein